MTSFWENGPILWTDGIKQMDLVIKDDSGGRGHTRRRADHENFFPTQDAHHHDPGRRRLHLRSRPLATPA